MMKKVKYYTSMHKKACVVKINNNRYHALKPKMSKEMKLKKTIKTIYS